MPSKQEMPDYVMQMTKLDPDGAGKLLQPPTGGNDAVSL